MGSAGCNFPFTLLPCLSLLFALPAVACPAAAPNRIGWLGKWECNPSPRSSREAPLSHFTLHYPTSAPQSFFSSRTLTASLHFNSFEPCPTVSRVTDETNHRRRNSNVPAVWQFISSLHSQRKHPPPSTTYKCEAADLDCTYCIEDETPITFAPRPSPAQVTAHANHPRHRLAVWTCEGAAGLSFLTCDIVLAY